MSGIRLQQFNRSPQVLEPPRQLLYPEQNANFIEVAIPFSQLGDLQPGDTIKLAAVAGLGGYDTNAQTRELDTSFLGSSMVGAGQSNVVLGAVSVRLASSVTPMLSMAQSLGNTFTITLLGTTNVQYYLLTTTNLAIPTANWTVLTDSTNTATNGMWYYRATAGPSGDDSTGMRFFRAQAVAPYP